MIVFMKCLSKWVVKHTKFFLPFKTKPMCIGLCGQRLDKSWLLLSLNPIRLSLDNRSIAMFGILVMFGIGAELCFVRESFIFGASSFGDPSLRKNYCVTTPSSCNKPQQPAIHLHLQIVTYLIAWRKKMWLQLKLTSYFPWNKFGSQKKMLLNQIHFHRTWKFKGWIIRRHFLQMDIVYV